MPEPLLSVIVCTYERAGLLALNLESLARQQAPGVEWEVLVVDNDSHDHTARIIEKYRAQLPGFRSLVSQERNLSVARNTGAEAARGDYLIYLDDDAKVPSDYVGSVAAVAREHAPDIFGGPVFPYYTVEKPFWFRDSYETKMFTAASEFSTTCRVTGANFIIRRELLRELGGFDPARGMQGRTYVIGDERKVLETYRAHTPLAAQRVFYAHECAVEHHVDPRKLQFGYFLYRSYVGARSNVIIRRELKKPVHSPSLVVREAVRWPWRVAQSCVNEARERGWREGDYAASLAKAAGQLGTLVESTRQCWIDRRRFRGARREAAR